MSIRTKTFCILLVTLTCLVILVAVASYPLLLSNYLHLETVQMRRQANQARYALEDEAEDLLTTARDWGLWDELCQYVDGQNPSFLRTYMHPLALNTLNIDLVAFFDEHGRLCQAFRHEQGDARRCPPELHALVQSGLRHTEYGLLRVRDGVLMLATSPIRHSDGRGPSHGTLVMARYLDQAEQTSLTETTGLSLNIEPWESSATPDFRRARQRMTRSRTTVLPLSDDWVAGYARLDDLTGKPAVIIRVTERRNLFLQGKHFLWFRIGLLALVGFIICGISLVLLDRLVLWRLLRLHDQVQAIEAQGTFTARVSVPGADEISRLAGAMNGMLAALQRAEEAEVGRAHSLLVAALDTLPLPMALLTPSLEITFANSTMRTVIEREGSRQLGDIPLLYPVTLAPVPLNMRPTVRVMQGEATAVLDAVLPLKDGELQPVLVLAGGVYVEGALTTIIVAVQDLTELKNADKEKNEFLAVLSHELLTPLTSILGWAEMALAKPDVTSHMKALEVVLRNARRQKRLVDDLLDMSRLMHRKLVLTPATLDLREVAEQCIENQAQSTARHRVMIGAHWQDETLPIHGDAVRLQQAVSNLLA